MRGKRPNRMEGRRREIVCALKSARKKQGLTRYAVWKRLNDLHGKDSGLSQPALSRVESETVGFSIDGLLLYLEGLGITMHLRDGEGNEIFSTAPNVNVS